MKMNNPIGKRTLAAIIGVVAATGLLTLTPSFEGTKLTTYRDIGGVLTYCTGATEHAVWGKTYTPDECRAQLDKDLAEAAEGVVACMHVPLSDGQAIAFVDAAYNIGIAGFCHSSMARLTNAGDKAGGCNALMLWNTVHGEPVRGLTIRRAVEREFCTGARHAG